MPSIPIKELPEIDASKIKPEMNFDELLQYSARGLYHLRNLKELPPHAQAQLLSLELVYALAIEVKKLKEKYDN